MQIQVDNDNYFRINQFLKDSVRKDDVVEFMFGKEEVTAKWVVTFLIVESNGGTVKINAKFFCNYTKKICKRKGWIHGDY